MKVDMDNVRKPLTSALCLTLQSRAVNSEVTGQ